MRKVMSGLLLCAVLSSAASSQELRGPDLAVASNFGQGFLADLLTQSIGAGITDYRDALYWDRVEGADGTFRFETAETVYPDLLAAAGATMSLTVNNGHPAYQTGETPTTEKAARAFGRHAAETVARFPAITAIEVGNEFNSANFVTGPLRDAGLDARASAYVALLREVATQARAVRPDIRIIGGGVHSIPTGYLDKLFALGAGDYMDSIALHPYSTPVEHYAKQIKVMRRNPQLAKIPIEITEFGTQDPGQGPGKLIRSHCQYALAGASRLAWYALNERGDDYEPLITRDGTRTATWQAFAFAQTELAGHVVSDVAPDPFTYACLYDDRKLVIWGMQRQVTLVSPNLTVFDATGRQLDGPAFELSQTEPLIVIAPNQLSLERDLRLAPQTVLADSYHGFTYPPDGRAGGGFTRFAGADTAFATMPGQARAGRPWTPWLGIPGNGDIRLLPRTMLPGGTGQSPVSITHRYTATTAQAVELTGTFTPVPRSADGISVTILRDGKVIAAQTGKGTLQFDAIRLDLAAGTQLDVVVGPGETASGDLTDYRITVRQAQ